MKPLPKIEKTRRWFFEQCGVGLGAIALGNLLTSAALLGVDACPMEGFVPAQYDEILGLNQMGLTSISLCALGYRLPTDPYAGAPKVRFPKHQVVYHVGGTHGSKIG